MKKQKLQFLYGAIAMIGFTACSDTNDVAGDVTQQEGYATTIQVTADNAAQAGTRSLTPDANNNIVSEWKSGDKMFIYDIADDDQSNEANYSLVTMAANSSNKQKADFTGTVKTLKPMKTTDDLAFFYPGTAVEGEKTVEQVNPKVEKETGAGGVNLQYHTSENPSTNQKYGIRSTVSLDMKKQDGTLPTIDQKFDYNWGKAKPTEVKNDNGQKIVKTEVTLNRKVTIWGVKFKIVNGPSSTGFIKDIDSVKINGLRSYDVLNLKDGSFVGTSDEKEYMITVANKDKSKIQLQNDYVWVAFLGEDASTDFTITVYTQDGVYTKTASKIFKTGYDYRSNITVEKITPQPYVTVNNVTWATGNFIHYKKGSQEYWGIAPAQWWISSYGENPTSVNKADNKNIKYDGLGSQNWFIGDHIGKFTQTADDVDLFQWGVINDALKFNGVYYLQGTNFDMAGKYYKNRGGLINVNETSNRAEATHGDIVRYYTEHGQKHYHYQYPSDADFNALFSANTCIPAYCYTDKGNKIYGAYFSDMKFAGSGSKFPTGRKIWKYQDVSGLVLANKGLFLPIGGRRPLSSAYVEFRHVANNSGFYGQYYTSKSPTYSIPHGVFFGAAFKMNISVPSKDQGSNIRPVYVGADNDDETKPIDAAKFAAFNNIIDATGRKY
ncbi:MAG: hypothetical protein HXO27_08075 [Prevotella sp.]|nr:hypothetical protein [Prevotella sp.]